METQNSPPLCLPRKPNFLHPTSITVNNEPRRSKQPVLPKIDRCTSIKQLKQFHAQMLRSGIFSDPYSASKLFEAAVLSSFSSLEYARKVFDEIPQPNLFTWNTLIRAYASSSDPSQSILIFLRMLYESPCVPNKFTFPFVIKAATAAELSGLHLGKALHGMVIKSALGEDLYIKNSLINLYSSCGDFDLADKVFEMIDQKDVVSWNSMITGLARNGCAEKALEVFKRMEDDNVKPSDITMISVLSACTKMLDLEFGKKVCSFIESNGTNTDLKVSNAMLDMYLKCGSFDDAKRLFDKMEEKDIITWTIMLDGHAKSGHYEEARRILEAMPTKEIGGWNALISANEQNGRPKEALAIFHELQIAKTPEPDEITLVSALSACSQLGAMDTGCYIHGYIKKQGIELSCPITTSLIDMYSKCGDLEKALEVFHSVETRDVFVWSSMIAGLAMHGRGRTAVDFFYRMQEAQIKPNSVTFTNLLCACSHAGLVREGKLFFEQMQPIYGVTPESRHYVCLVDTLGRAGLIEEALEFIEKMPIAPCDSIWGALLGACKVHGNVAIAEKAFSRLLELDPKNDGGYVILSNTYAKSGQWGNVAKLRKHMRVSGLMKQRGCSAIEVNGVINEFLAGDNSHPLCKQIYSKLDEIMAWLKRNGYEPNTSHLLHQIEEEGMQEQALNLHSEKLAIAFGLISLERSKPIRIIKNQRICGDCHTVAKLISKLYDKEIVVRDRFRFHHFREGNCSCMDFW